MFQTAKRVLYTTPLLAVGSAMAALPADVDTAITAAQTDLLAMVGKGFAIVGAVAAVWVVLGLFKKVIKKAG